MLNITQFMHEIIIIYFDFQLYASSDFFSTVLNNDCYYTISRQYAAEKKNVETVTLGTNIVSGVFKYFEHK